MHSLSVDSPGRRTGPGSPRVLWWAHSWPYVMLGLLLAATAAPGGPVAPENAEAIRDGQPAYQSYGQYCGVYSVYALLKLFDKNVAFAQLVRHEYIGSAEGSSLGELKTAVEDHGLYAAPVCRLTPRTLRGCPYPVILHVKSAPDRRSYDHYQLFLGMVKGKARTLDGPAPVQLVEFHELASRWDGNGLVVSPVPIRLGRVLGGARLRLLVCGGLMAAVVLAVRGLRRCLPSLVFETKSGRLALSIAQGVMLGATALLGGMAYHLVADQGFLACPGDIRSLRGAFAGRFLPQVDLRAVARLLGTDTVFIDARRVADYESGHLEGAISIPVSADNEWRRKTMSEIAKDATIIVYCQSSGCRYAERVALRLIDDEFIDVSVFKGGWREWIAARDKDGARRS